MVLADTAAWSVWKWGPLNPTTNVSLPNEQELDLSLRLPASGGRWKGLSVWARYADVFSAGAGVRNDQLEFRMASFSAADRESIAAAARRTPHYRGCSSRNFTRPSTTRRQVLSHSCLLICVATSQSLMHSAKYWAVRSRN